VGESIVRNALRGIEPQAFVVKELAGEFVTIHNSENSAVNVNTHAQVQILVTIVAGTVWFGHLMSFEENALGQTRVLDFLFVDVEGVVVEIIVDSAPTNPEVLVGVLNDGLLEVTHEIKDLYKLILEGAYLSVVLQPLGSDFGDCVVLLWSSLGHSGDSEGGALAHGPQEVGVYVLSKTRRLFYLKQLFLAEAYPAWIHRARRSAAKSCGSE